MRYTSHWHNMGPIPEGPIWRKHLRYSSHAPFQVITLHIHSHAMDAVFAAGKFKGRWYSDVAGIWVACFWIAWRVECINSGDFSMRMLSWSRLHICMHTVFMPEKDVCNIHTVLVGFSTMSTRERGTSLGQTTVLQITSFFATTSWTTTCCWSRVPVCQPAGAGDKTLTWCEEKNTKTTRIRSLNVWHPIIIKTIDPIFQCQAVKQPFAPGPRSKSHLQARVNGGR